VPNVFAIPMLLFTLSFLCKVTNNAKNECHGIQYRCSDSTIKLRIHYGLTYHGISATHSYGDLLFT